MYSIIVTVVCSILYCIHVNIVYIHMYGICTYTLHYIEVRYYLLLAFCSGGSGAIPQGTTIEQMIRHGRNHNHNHDER
jgi:hypothetical protein